MKVRVHVSGPRAATIHCTPSWWERMRGLVDLDDCAIGVPSVAGGTLWLLDSTGRRIRSRKIVDAIEREQARVAGEARRAAQLQRR